jgi:hypothetical protein
MKKLTVFLCSLALVFSVTGIAGAISIPSCVGDDCFKDVVRFGHCDLGLLLSGAGEYSWEHRTPSDFEVPFDTVQSATLEIFAKFVDEDEASVLAEGTLFGTFSNATWSWSSWRIEGSSYDVAPILRTGWTNSESFDVTLGYDEGFSRVFCREIPGHLYLASSVLKICYENGTAPVPEPSTILLMGAGLLGLVAVGRRKFNRKE